MVSSADKRRGGLQRREWGEGVGLGLAPQGMEPSSPLCSEAPPQKDTSKADLTRGVQMPPSSLLLQRWPLLGEFRVRMRTWPLCLAKSP